MNRRASDEPRAQAPDRGAPAHCGSTALPAAAFVLLAAFAQGCLVGPKYARPAVPEPPQFRFASSAEPRSIADLPWWELFRDPRLDELIRTALEHNLDARIAAWRVEEARAIAGIDRWALYPGVGANASVIGGRRVIGTSPTPVTGELFSVQAQIAWELDVWGRLRRAREASGATFEAAVETRNGVISALVADVAQSYFQLLALDRAREVLEATLRNRQEQFDVYSARLKGGIGNQVEVSTGQAQLEGARAALADVRQQLGQSENALAVLIGRTPEEIRRRPAGTAAPEPPNVPPGLPSALLTRRPDIRVAEQQLISANARVGEAEANFFPQLSLTGALGLVSPELAKLVSGDSVTWSAGVAAGILAPVLKGHALIDQKDAAVARFEQAKAAYEKAVLVALREVADALLAEQQARERITALEHQVAALEQRRSLAHARFTGGVANYLEEITAEENLLPVQLALEQTRLQHAAAIVQLYRALGGGWSVASGHRE